MGPLVDLKKVGGPDGVNPYKIMLLSQFLQLFSVMLANCIGFRCHVGWVKLVSEPVGKSTQGPQRDRQRAYDLTNVELALGSAHGFFIFMLGVSDHEGHIPKMAQQPCNIQHTLL